MKCYQALFRFSDFSDGPGNEAKNILHRVSGQNLWRQPRRTVVFVQIEVLGTRQSMIYQDQDRRALTRMDIKETPTIK